MAAPRIAKQIGGTVIATLAGWLAGLLFLEIGTVLLLLQHKSYVAPEALYVGPMIWTWFMAYFVVPIWLLVLIPLYLFIPSSSKLWRWPVCTLCGAVAGVAVITMALRGVPGFGQVSAEAWS